MYRNIYSCYVLISYSQHKIFNHCFRRISVTLHLMQLLGYTYFDAHLATQAGYWTQTVAIRLPFLRPDS
jgi:hypothetical protein